MRNLYALLGLTKYALANVYMSRDERRRVRGSTRKGSFASALSAAASFMVSLAVSLASDVRAIGVLCALGIRNLLHDAKVALARERSRD
jgi:hypothetical protein